MTKQNKIISWVLQIVVVAIILPTAIGKLSDNPQAIELFTKLDMEPNGRYLIGALELIAALLLLIPASVVYGAGLSLGLMAGAVIGHVSKLGFEGKMGMLAGMAVGAILFCLVILFIRRKQLPIVHRMFGTK